MSNERERLRERLEQIEAEMARSDPRFVSKEVREIVELGRKALSLLTQAQKPVEPIMYAALMEAKTEAATLRKKLDEWIAYADSLASPVASAPEEEREAERKAFYAGMDAGTSMCDLGYLATTEREQHFQKWLRATPTEEQTDG